MPGAVGDGKMDTYKNRNFLFFAKNPSGYTGVYTEVLTDAPDEKIIETASMWLETQKQVEEGWIVYVLPLDVEGVQKFSVEREPAKIVPKED